jgi:putative MATE family efflux protein
MAILFDRIPTAWQRTFRLGWPITTEQSFNTLMRTVDIIVTGLFSPAAVAAIGLADLYAQVPLRVGLGLGTGAIALSSQDTGREATLTRDRAITQALLVGGLCGIPFVIIGIQLDQMLISLLGAKPNVVRLGGAYLTTILISAPMRITGLIGARSLQGAGDTRTPMIINVGTNLVNILLTIGLGLGLWIAPQLGIVGIGIATAISRAFESLAMVGAIVSPRKPLSIALPRDLTITQQLIAVSLPNFAEGMSSSLANFPFNALLLLFGTEATASYHIARRIYQQLAGPLYRSFATASSIIIGQTLGEGDPAEARHAAKSILVLSVLTLGCVGVILLFVAEQLVIGYVTKFTRAFGFSMPFIGIFFPLAGVLRGAGDTRTPFYARFTGVSVFMLSGSYFLGVTLGLELLGVYIGIVLSYICWATVVGLGFTHGRWAETAAAMMSKRAETSDAHEQSE